MEKIRTNWKKIWESILYRTKNDETRLPEGDEAENPKDITYEAEPGELEPDEAEFDELETDEAEFDESEPDESEPDEAEFDETELDEESLWEASDMRGARKGIKYHLGRIWSWIKENKKKVAISAAAAVILLGCVFWFFLRTYHNYEVVDSMERKTDTSANYYFREDGVVCYSKDGISFTNNNGEVIWNQVFGMAAPKMSTCGDYMAIGDVGANSVYIFNGTGLEGRIALEKPVQDIRVSRQGVIAVVLSDNDANQINLYNKQGEILAGVKASISTTGYPLTLALSEDGTHLVVSYVVFSGGKISSRLVFYNFANAETSGEPAGSFEYEELFPRLEFVGEHTVLACGANGFHTYQFKDTVSEKFNYTFETEAKSIFVTDKNIGIITKNTEEAKEGKTVDKYAVKVYRFSGGKAASFTFDFDYKSVSASNSDIIFYNDQECEIYTYRGHKKFQYVFEHNIESVLPGIDSGEYILIDIQSVQTIRLK